jgi:TRAP-type mannitol/chloroaromatic compound transport system permease small subunit
MNLIDRISTWVGKAVAWLVPILILELVYDTAARYLFNAPTSWSFDISYMLYGVIFMGGAAMTLQQDKHVRIEVIYGQLSARARAVIDAICYLIFFFPAVGVIVYYGALFAAKSWSLLETSDQSMWQPPIYPFKTVLPVAGALLFLQGLAEFARCVRTIVTGRSARS